MTKGRAKVLSALGLALLSIMWILQNGGSVETKFLFFTVTMPLAFLLAITLLVGIVAGILLALGKPSTWNRKS